MTAPLGSAEGDVATAPVVRRLVAAGRCPAFRYALAGAVTTVVFVVLVIPQFRSAAHDLALLRRVPPGWVAAGIVLEAVSFVAYGLYTRTVLPAEGRPRYHRLLRIDVVGSGLSHVVPGGGAVASGVRFRLLCRAGVDGTQAAFGSVLQGLGSSVVVNGLLLVGLVFARPAPGTAWLYLGAAVVAVAHMAVVVGLWLGMSRGEARGVAVLHRVAAWVRWSEGRVEALERAVRQVSARCRQLRDDRRLLARAVAWSAANWLFDVASLWTFLLAFGHRVQVGDLLLAFGLAHTLALLPISPGGVGVVEGSLIPALVAFGTPKSTALVGVLSWRLFNFWAPIPAGGLAWVSLGASGRGVT